MNSNQSKPFVLILLLSIDVICPVRAQAIATYTEAQAEIGEDAYGQHCSRCHGDGLQGSPFGPALVGDGFARHWAGRPAGQLLAKIRSTMPPGNAGALTDSTYAALIAYILESYGVEGNSSELPSNVAEGDELLLPSREILARRPAGGPALLARGVVPLEQQSGVSPLDKLTLVSDQLLENPPESSWLTWRRTLDAVGFSPLKQITKATVGKLRVAWTLALPPGPNEATPLVLDGVLFVHSYGDHVQALNARSGEELWHYHRELPSGAQPTQHRNMALYDDKLYFTTSDAQVVALKARTGEIAWEQSIADPRNTITWATGGPLIIRGVLMQGVLGFLKGGGYIVGLDAKTGKFLWRFNTVAQPDEPNGNSWNDLPWEGRTGGSVWTAGSFLTKEGLALFGPAPTYDTKPLRYPASKQGTTNDALYTNATIALDPQTGRLAWHYQHLPNDQWDLDWAFERQILDVRVAGVGRRVILTAGKEALYDALDASTGHYLFSIDLGLQNLITAIDPTSGAKTVNGALIPDYSNRVTVCPHAAGAKSWLPGSYDPTTGILYVPLVESCMDMVPTRKGRHNFQLRPRPGSDGKYGRLQAINLETRTPVWTNRQRAPQTTGVLATAGGLLFAGALDRWFTAYASDTGQKLWQVRLTDVPNSNPIMYAVDGRSYVAMVVGAGLGQAEAFRPLVPEIRPPAAPSSAIWVFTLD